MYRSVATADYGRRKPVAQAVTAEEFLTRAACAALTGLLANPTAHEEHIRWDDLTREAWDIAAEMVKSAPAGVLADGGRSATES